METLKRICTHLEDCVLSELGKDKSQINAQELGEVVDAIKDVKMAIYYASIVDAMEESEYGKDYDLNGKMYYNRHIGGAGSNRYSRKYTPHYQMTMEDYKDYSPEEMRDMDRRQGRMYYTDSNHMFRHYHENMGSADENMKLQSIEKDMDKMTNELMEVHDNMSNAEKTMLRTKMQMLIDRL